MLAAAVMAAAFVGSPAHSVGTDEPSNSNGSPGVQAGPFRIVSQGFENYCLDSNYAGDVYVLPCTVPNNFQRWQLWYGGWTKNVQTGLCLTLKPNWTLRAESCRWGDPTQEWKQWHGGWYQNHASFACLEYTGFLSAQRCRNYVYQRWYQQNF